MKDIIVKSVMPRWSKVDNEYKIPERIRNDIINLALVYKIKEAKLIDEFLKIRFSDKVLAFEGSFKDQYTWALLIGKYTSHEEIEEPIVEEQEIDNPDNLVYDDEPPNDYPEEEPIDDTPEHEEPKLKDIKVVDEESPPVVDGQPVISTSKIIIDGTLYEQIQGNRYVYLKDSKTVGVVHRVEHNGINHIPISDRTTEVIPLPYVAIEYGSAERLIEEIEIFIDKYLDITPQFRKLCAWYVVMTWVYDNLPTINYLRVIGDTSKGKSRFFQTISSICYKPIQIAAAVTAAPIFRLMNKWHGTLCIDECVLQKSEMGDAIIQVLNAGIEHGGHVWRCSTNNNEPEPFIAFGPKIIAARIPFDDDALNSRCITEQMILTTKRTDIPVNLPTSFRVDAALLRNQLLLYRLRNWNQVNSENIGKIKLSSVNRRLQQMMMPFAITFYNHPKIIEDLDNFMKNYSKQQKDDRSETLEGGIVFAYCLLHNSTTKPEYEQISSKDILKKMIEFGYDVEGTHPIKIGKVKNSLSIKSKQRTINKISKLSWIWDDKLMTELKNKYLTSEQIDILKLEQEQETKILRKLSNFD